MSFLKTLYILIERSKTKTLDFTSGGYLEVYLVKFSARSDKVKGRFLVAQWKDFDKKSVLRKIGPDDQVPGAGRLIVKTRHRMT